MNRDAIYDQGFVRLAACPTRTHLGDPDANAEEIISTAKTLAERGVGLGVFSELTLTGLSMGDFFGSGALMSSVTKALAKVLAATTNIGTALVFGAPINHGGHRYDCAIVASRGAILGVVPKCNLSPDERRNFASGLGGAREIEIFDEYIPFGTDLIFSAFDVPGLKFHVAFSRDAKAPVSASDLAAMSGANVLAILDDSPALCGAEDSRERIWQELSRRNIAATVVCAPGVGESTSEASWDNHALICENGRTLVKAELFPACPAPILADADLDVLRFDRAADAPFGNNSAAPGDTVFSDEQMQARVIEFELNPPRTDIGLERVVDRFPFLPPEKDLASQCARAYQIQVSALAQRLAAIGNAKVVLGVSGGLDSTQALLVAAKVMDLASRPRTDVLAFTMPGFATTSHTKSNAKRLAAALGCTFETLDIRPTAELFLDTIGHPKDCYDVTFENVQAGLRTDYLFRIANQRHGIVLGTGDMSELALGWCTYGVGDQMSHYAINAGIPKTLMQHLIRWVISTNEFGDEVSEILQSILDTEVTPELIPASAGEKPQTTEGSIGPYNLHDFTLYWTLRYGLRPSKIAFLAENAWSDADKGEWPANFPLDNRVSYDRATINKWLEVFGRRFHSQQFKRTASPDGPQVLDVGSLSPRQGWLAPGDISATAWLEDLTEGDD